MRASDNNEKGRDEEEQSNNDTIGNGKTQGMH